MSLPDWLAGQALAAVAAPLRGDRDWRRGSTSCRNSSATARPSPIPHARAVIAGLGMDARRRLASSRSMSRGSAASATGCGRSSRPRPRAAHPSRPIVISGGAGRHPLVRQLLADSAGLPVVATRAAEPVLLGSAILGAVAAGAFPDIPAAMEAMSVRDAVYAPDPSVAGLHERRFDAFRRLQLTAREIAQAGGNDA